MMPNESSIKANAIVRAGSVGFFCSDLLVAVKLK